MATFTASDSSEIVLLNDSYTWLVSASFVDFVSSGSFELTYVPEPTTASLLAIGLLGLAFQRRRH